MTTALQLQNVMPTLTAAAAEIWAPLFNAAETQFGIDQTPQREAMFIAQVAHESGELRWLRELASGDEYEGRASLGNTQPGDGRKFKGRGGIQTTGRRNYEDCSLALFGDMRLIDHPELLELPQYAILSAAWFWQAHGLNVIADTGNFDAVTRVVNGGTSGAAERLAYLERAQAFA